MATTAVFVFAAIQDEGPSEFGQTTMVGRLGNLPNGVSLDVSDGEVYYHRNFDRIAYILKVITAVPYPLGFDAVVSYGPPGKPIKSTQTTWRLSPISPLYSIILANPHKGVKKGWVITVTLTPRASDAGKK
ncbi:MAG: hypothetical protein ACYCOU_12740 [Sulfobacillus sp.]